MKWFGVAAAVASSTIAANALAEASVGDPTPAPAPIDHPVWERSLSATDQAALFPVAAFAARIPGQATVRCRVRANGTLSECQVVSESPAGYGFARATLQAMRLYKMAPKLPDGRAVEGGVVRIAIDWPVPSAPPPERAPATTAATPGQPYIQPRVLLPPAPSPPPMTTDVPLAWEKTPSRAQLDALYPRDAKAKKIGGDTAMTCLIEVDGRLSSCHLDLERPAGTGFGQASLAAARFFRMKMPSAPGSLLRGVRVPIRWGDGDAALGGKPVPATETFAPHAPEFIARPDWERMPNGEGLADLYPPVAAEKHVEGRATMQCTVLEDGRLDGCIVLNEEPTGYGFARATLQSARWFKMRPRTINGAPVGGGRVIIPLAWSLPLGDGFGVSAPTLDPPQVSANGGLSVWVAWGASPTYADIDALFPGRAVVSSVGGEATMRCRVEADGRLSNCAIISEDPPGYDFGAATLALAAKYRVNPTTSDHGPTAGLFVTTAVTWSQNQRRLVHFRDHPQPLPIMARPDRACNSDTDGAAVAKTPGC